MPTHFSIREAAEQLAQHRKSFDDPKSHPACFATLLRHGTLEVELYQPVDIDQQQPHAKDELYVIATGTADFDVTGQPRRSVAAGDVLFVPAGVELRFIEFGDDFSTWVFLYGPQGGEQRNHTHRKAK